MLEKWNLLKSDIFLFFVILDILRFGKLKELKRWNLIWKPWTENKTFDWEVTELDIQWQTFKLRFNSFNRKKVLYCVQGLAFQGSLFSCKIISSFIVLGNMFSQKSGFMDSTFQRNPFHRKPFNKWDISLIFHLIKRHFIDWTFHKYDVS